MSTAVLISGQLRTFARCWPTQRWHVLRHFADPHFFITVQGNPALDTIPDIAALREEVGADRVHYDPRTDPDLSAQLTPQLTAAYHNAPYANAAPAHQLLLQHWYQNECWKFFETIEAKLPARREKIGRYDEYRQPNGYVEAEVPVRFDTIIRLRADLWFHSFELPSFEWGNEHPGEAHAHTPWWGRFGGINDRFAILGREAARAYFTTYEHIPELLAAGCPFHPESLVAASLERSNITLHDTLRTEFSTLRLNGEQRWPEITPIDIAHTALRAA